MSRNLTPSHIWTAGHIGSPEISEPQPVAVEPVYFLELPQVGETYLNGEGRNVDMQTWSVWQSVLRRVFAQNETLPNSGVYRMTKSELAVLHQRGEEIKQMADMLTGV